MGNKSITVQIFAESIFKMTAELKNKLSKTELKISLLLEQGLSNKSISERCDISENTVKFHLKNIYKKLGVHNRLQAVHIIHNK